MHGNSATIYKIKSGDSWISKKPTQYRMTSYPIAPLIHKIQGVLMKRGSHDSFIAFIYLFIDISGALFPCLKPHNIGIDYSIFERVKCIQIIDFFGKISEVNIY